MDKTMNIDWHHKQEMMGTLLTDIFGLEVWDDSVEHTAHRVLKYWMDHRPDNKMDFELTVFPTKVNQLIVVNNIEFSSLCAHHLLPFWGIAHVGYVPNTLAVGLSKIPRVVDHFAAQPQMQERLTADIASFLKKKLTAQGVAVVIIAKHTCMACRGVRKHNGHMTTSEMRGVFITGAAARAEFLQLINTNVTL
jgi:GTP cyclohydrolase I